MDKSETKQSRDKTCSAGLASDNVSLSDEMLSLVRRWLDDAELQLSDAAHAKMNADSDITVHNVQPLFNGLLLLMMSLLSVVLMRVQYCCGHSNLLYNFLIYCVIKH